MPAQLIPHTVPVTIWEHVPRSLFAATIRSGDVPKTCQVALIGLPDDTGVYLNHGRPGAKDGPRAFREALACYGVAMPAGFDWPQVFDVGDVVPGADIYETHDRVTEAVSALLDLNLLPIAIGGGHDLTYPFVRAVAQRYPRLTGIYFDAHLDVRPEVGSGMAFRKIVEECGVQELHLQGFRRLVNARQHLQWFTEHGGRIHAFGPSDPWPGGDLFVSLDLDVIASAYAPGVSAPNPTGWTPTEAEEWVLAAGHGSRVRCFDIMELNPVFDVDGRTARLSAHLFLCFLQGLTERDR